MKLQLINPMWLYTTYLLLSATSVIITLCEYNFTSPLIKSYHHQPNIQMSRTNKLMPNTYFNPNALQTPITSTTSNRSMHQFGNVGGIGLVSGTQKHISLGALTNKNSQITVDNVRTLGSTAQLNKPEWPHLGKSNEFSKINMRIMGQSIDPSVVNHLHPDVSPHKARKLRKILSGSLDKEWTSESPPRVLRQRGISGAVLSPDQSNPNEMLDAKLLKELNELNFTFHNPFGTQINLSPEQLQLFRQWLLEQATCEMDFIWEDLGPLFWPRWIRRGVCLNRPGHSCSWPAGMKCRPSGSRALQLLHWKCEDSAQIQTREQAADQRTRRRATSNSFHSGFYDMEPASVSADKALSRDRRDAYARLSLRDNLGTSPTNYRKLHTRTTINHDQLQRQTINQSPLNKYTNEISVGERRRRRARRLIKRLSVTANGYHCYWQVQKYLISDRCSCSCS